MKVLTIKEPFATLISVGIKKTETRSFKTNYRGDLYIHTSLKKQEYDYKNADFKKLASKYNYEKLGYIICKCKLTDCIKMTPSYIEDMKTNHYEDYISGTYEVGRYGWVLEDVEIIKPIKAKGKLGIWNFDEGKEDK